jgi:protein TonB
MAREMFEAAAIGARRKGRWYTVPLSVVTHVALVAGFVIVPLIVTEALPLPSSVLVFATPPPPPTPVPPPATPEVPRPVATTAAVDPNIAPVVAPPAIVDPPPTVATFVHPASPGVLASSAPGVTLAAPPSPVPPPAPVGPIPVGGKIRPPAKTYDVVPVYPTIARAAHVQGTVRIEATIAKDGSVRDARVVDSVKMLDEAALAAVRQWRYRPSYLNGEPIEVLMTVSVQFTLQ